MSQTDVQAWPPAEVPQPTLGEQVRSYAGRLGVYTAIAIISLFFALPMLWMILAPFDRVPSLSVAWPEFTLANFREILTNPLAVGSLWNSVILALGTIALVLLAGAPASYVLSRVRFPGRDLLLYVMLLFSSIVTGSAAMVPLFLMIFNMGLIDTHTGVVLVLTGGMLPAAIFILKDFTDSIPTSYEESARVFGANSFQVVKDIVFPVIQPGLAVIAVYVGVQVWGNFLMPFLLLRSPSQSPAAVLMYSFYTEGGQANLRLISTFSLVYTIPVVLLYLFVQRRYGFRFFGGIKG
jgi:multiple sugar transport system permease protein